MNIETMTVTELKAAAYEQVVLLEQTQNNLRILNAKIAEKSKVVEPALPVETPTTENPGKLSAEDTPV